VRAIRRFVGTTDRFALRAGAEQLALSDAGLPAPPPSVEPAASALRRTATTEAQGSAPTRDARHADTSVAARSWPNETRLVATLFSNAALHDRECVQAASRVRAASATPPLDTNVDLDGALDDWRRATTTLCALLAVAARVQVRPLVPFAKQLILGGAFESMDDRAIDAFVRPVFETAGLGDRFVRDSRSSDPSPQPTVEDAQQPMSSTQPVTTEPEILFDHLLGSCERITFARAYDALVGPLGGTWTLKHLSKVAEIARGTRPRRVGDIELQLESLIVNKKTGLPRGHGGAAPGHTLDAWVAQFGAWSLCSHVGRELSEPAPAGVQPIG
jgi:hypothetical protein